MKRDRSSGAGVSADVDFQGTRRARRVAGPVTLSEVVYEAGRQLPVHAHEHPFFALVLSGAFTERLDRRTRACAPSSLAYYPPSLPHADTFAAGGGRAFLVELDRSWADGCLHGAVADACLGEIRGSPLNLLALRLYAAFLRSEPAEELLVEETSLEMLAGVAAGDAPSDRQPPAWLGRVCERLHADRRRSPGLGALAELAGVHPSHLARTFRRHHGCTLGEYSRRLRIQAACDAVANTSMPLSSVALELGYADQAHFTRRFTAAVGMAPGRFRRLASRGAGPSAGDLTAVARVPAVHRTLVRAR